MHDDSSSTEGGDVFDNANALAKGTRLFEFEIERVLGEGGFAIVYLAFDHSLHRAAQGDLPQAKFLLKKAGQDNLTVTLTTSAVATGTVAMATVLAAQAKAAGITVKLSNVPAGTFFGPNYLKWPFAQDYYNYYPYLSQVSESMLKGSPFNETHTDNPHYTNLYNQANATASPALRKEIVQEMQKYDFTQGGYIIPAFLDALETAIRKTVESREFADGCARVGARPAFMDADGFGKLIASEDAELAGLMGATKHRGVADIVSQRKALGAAARADHAIHAD